MYGGPRSGAVSYAQGTPVRLSESLWIGRFLSRRCFFTTSFLKSCAHKDECRKVYRYPDDSISESLITTATRPRSPEYPSPLTGPAGVEQAKTPTSYSSDD